MSKQVEKYQNVAERFLGLVWNPRPVKYVERKSIKLGSAITYFHFNLVQWCSKYGPRAKVGPRKGSIQPAST